MNGVSHLHKGELIQILGHDFVHKCAVLFSKSDADICALVKHTDDFNCAHHACVIAHIFCHQYGTSVAAALQNPFQRLI